MAKNEIKLLLAGWCRKLPLHQPFSDVEHSHEFWQIDLCEKGDAQLKVGDSRFQISAGDIVIIEADRDLRDGDRVMHEIK